jgi:hypothetical protein
LKHSSARSPGGYQAENKGFDTVRYRPEHSGCREGSRKFYKRLVEEKDAFTLPEKSGRLWKIKEGFAITPR